tara:strand:- start:35072 stop:35248 length:177 start_codon:yes stop_codon:yes gene_type:complete
MTKKAEVSRQTAAHRAKTWTLVLYNAKGKAYDVSPKHCVLNPSKDKIAKSPSKKKSGG